MLLHGATDIPGRPAREARCIGKRHWGELRLLSHHFQADFLSYATRLSREDLLEPLMAPSASWYRVPNRQYRRRDRFSMPSPVL